MSDEATVRQTLEGWARSSKLSSVTLSEDGTSLSLEGTSVAANVPLNLTHEGKSCSYSAASIFLQLLDPNQGLVAYRSVCKKHSVTDPVKAIDKPIVLGAFLGLTTGLASEATGAPAAAAAAPATTAAVAPPPPAAKRPDRKHDRKKSSSSKRKEPSSKRRDRHHHKSEKKAKELVTNEQLFDSLNVVVDKRQGSEHLRKEMEEIMQALSPKGFEVTPELLQKYHERTKIITSNEMPVGNSASILRAANPNKNLSRVLELFNEGKRSSNNGRHASGEKKSSATTTAPAAKVVRKHLLGKKPIIIVPKGMTAALTLANAHEFLCNARFVPRDVLVKQGRHRSPATTFTRAVSGASGATGLLEYEIIDNPRKLGNKSEDWDRVVAVIVLGQSWQFKDWLKGYNAPATLFEKAFGFFVCMEGAKVPAEVPNWAVHQSRLNRDKRGLDQVAYASFWNGLDEFMRVRKPELLPQADV